MKRNVIIIALSLVIILALGIGIYGIVKNDSGEVVNPNVTLVTAPKQEGFEPHPEWMPEEVVEIDYGENLAVGKAITADGNNQVYVPANANDGDRYTYWEGVVNAYPNIITIDMGETTAMGAAQIQLNPNAVWAARTQEVEIQVSEDGENFTTILAKDTLRFDPKENNSAYVKFDAPVESQYIRFLFYSNTEATAGQAAEIAVYAP